MAQSSPSSGSILPAAAGKHLPAEAGNHLLELLLINLRRCLAARVSSRRHATA
jgi:hypothetical protein